MVVCVYQSCTLPVMIRWATSQAPSAGAQCRALRRFFSLWSACLLVRLHTFAYVGVYRVGQKLALAGFLSKFVTVAFVRLEYRTTTSGCFPDGTGLARSSSATCFGKEPLGISGIGFLQVGCLKCPVVCILRAGVQLHLLRAGVQPTLDPYAEAFI